MTTETTPVGRELDALVARRLFAWNEKDDGKLGPENWESSWEPPAYSTDIAAAWEVVERIHDKGLWISVGDSERDGLWGCVITARAGIVRPTVLAHEEAPTMPEAVCRAALAVAGSGLEAEEKRG